MFGFNKKQTPNTATAPQSQMKFSGRPSAKKKDTYIIGDLRRFMAQAELFELCKQTPLPIITLNGEPFDSSKNAWTSCTEFPNPAAHQLAVAQRCPEFHAIFGEKLACTIIVYRDKNTDTPILWLFPNGTLMSSGHIDGENLHLHLNHAQRKDLNYQLELRGEKMRLMAPLIASRNAALEHCPSQQSPEFSEFIRNLNEKQMAMANQILAAQMQK